MKNNLTIELLAMTAVAGTLFILPACTKRSSESAAQPAAGKTLYQCAMHPQIISDKPGECPICHMRLVRIENRAGGPSAEETGGISGQAPVHLAPGVEQRIGVRLAEAQVRDVVQPISAA